MRAEDRRHLTEAQGWLGLGDWQSAKAELDAITPNQRAHPKVLLCRVEEFALAGRWEDGATAARTLTTKLCKWGGGWWAFYVLARCEAQLGHYASAQSALQEAVPAAPMDIRQKALDDPALQPLWKHLGTIQPAKMPANPKQ